MNFKTWLEQYQQPVVSFDFDGVLHCDIIPGTNHPINFWSADLTPYPAMIEKLKEEARNNKVIIVTARDYGDKVPSLFVKNHNLPVSNVFCTDNGPKLATLQREKAIRHYDDSLRVKSELEGSNIEFVFVPPLNHPSKSRQQ